MTLPGNNDLYIVVEFYQIADNEDTYIFSMGDGVSRTLLFGNTAGGSTFVEGVGIARSEATFNQAWGKGWNVMLIEFKYNSGLSASKAYLWPYYLTR